MKSAKIIRLLTATVLSIGMILGNTVPTLANTSEETAIVEVAVAANQEADPTLDTMFKANLFDYDRDKVNKKSLAAVLEAASNEQKRQFSDNNVSAHLSLPGVMIFHNGGDFGEASKSFSYTDKDGNTISNRRLYTYNYNPTEINGKKYGYYNINNAGKGHEKEEYFTVTQGIAKDTLGDDGLIKFNYEVADLFGDSTFDGKSIYPSIDVPFIYEDGYYVMDSAEYSYTYQNGALVRGQENGGFWPFGNSNYWFGLNMQVEFMMNEEGIVDGVEEIFEFSGDDDVWVYIDDQLVLDLGGIHAACYGNINFATGVATIKNHVYSENKTASKTYNFGKMFNDGEVHTLRVFYLERGAGESNCKIKFNMPTINKNEEIKGDITFLKVEESNTKQTIEGAGFTLYNDMNCTDVVANEVFSDKNGVVRFKDLPTGIYYMKETTAPSQFYNPNGAVYKVILSGNSSDAMEVSILESKEDGFEVLPKMDGKFFITNSRIEVEDQENVSKTSKLVEGGWDDRIYEIKMSADINTTVKTTVTNTVKEPADVILLMDVSGSMDYPGDLESLGIKKINSLTSKENNTFKNYARNGYLYIIETSDKAALPVEVEYNSSNGFNVDGDSLSKSTSYEFYYSPSKGEVTRLDVMNEAALKFAEQLKDVTDENNIALVSFSYTNRGAQSATKDIVAPGRLDDAKLAEIKKALNKLEAGGGTRQDLALDRAYKLLKDNDTFKKSGNQQFVVLLTDGFPDDYSDQASVSTIISNASKNADSIENLDATIATVALDLNYFKENATLKELFGSVASSEDLQYWGSSSELTAIFSKLLSTFTQDEYTTTYKVAEVRDYIDDRFVVLDDNNKIITVDRIKKEGGSVTLANGGVVKYDSDRKLVYVTWGQDTPVELKEWTKTIYVQAKESYMGGNNVTTNETKSGIYVEGKLYREFDRPVVNVKSELFIDNTVNTIFLGNAVSTEEKLLKQVFDENNYNVELNMNWFVDQDCKQAITLEEMAQVVPVDVNDVKEFYLQVTYFAGEPTKESTENSLGNISGGKDFTQYAENTGVGMEWAKEKQFGVYRTEIVDGKLTITKDFDANVISNLPYTSTQKEKIDANQTAVFTVYRFEKGTTNFALKNAKESFQVTITDGVRNNQITISGLKEGIYKVVEDEAWSWKYKLLPNKGESKIDGLDGAKDGVVYIGMNAEQVYEENTISFQNILDKTIKWFSDTTNALNIFN